MKDILTLAKRAAQGDAKVLITGESGVGKDLIARQIHEGSKRSGSAFVAVNCAGLADTLLESELFGHVKGSFTGAYRDKMGKLQLAHRGTLFLDEVGEMTLRMQALLLRFLENGEIQAVGSDRMPTKVDVRVVAATNRNLSDMVASGQFRSDLLYRLKVIHLHVPPLRERSEDVRRLVQHFAERSSRPIVFTDAALNVLERYRWPGNVRELVNVVEQTIWLSESDVIDVEGLPIQIREAQDKLLPTSDRRRQLADDLYQSLLKGESSFWENIYPLFLSRDMTRHDLRELVRCGLRGGHGNYRSMLKLFGIPSRDYKRFMNFLAAHDCRVDYRQFRRSTSGSSLETPHAASVHDDDADADTEVFGASVPHESGAHLQ